MKVILTALATISSIAVLAEENERFVTGFTIDTLYVYDDNAEEISRIKAKSVELKEVVVAGKPGKGLKIHDQDDVEGLVQVAIDPDSDELVWLETMAVKIEPDNRLNCPTAVAAEQKVSSRAMTIGFGEHCADVAQQAGVEEGQLE